MNKPKLVKAMRLALRFEGDYWNAYLAPVGTMEGALLLGSMRMSIAENDEEARRDFQALMSSVLSRQIEELVGVAPVLKQEAAPEHERSGNA